MEHELREDLAPDTAELADQLLERLGVANTRGRVEIEFEHGRCLKIFRVDRYSRSELVRFDPA